MIRITTLLTLSIFIYSISITAQDLSENIISKGLRHPVKTKAADINNDGLLDIVVRTSDQELNWLQNLGGGEFSEPIFITNAISSFNLFDRDNDGDTDIILCSTVEGIIWLENIAETFNTIHVIAGDEISSRSAHFADIDGDGDLDVVACNNGLGSVFWHEYSGDGNYENAVNISTTLSNIYQITPTDVDGDEDIDIISTSTLAGTRLYRNTGDGNFSSYESIGGDSRSLHVVDIEGDNDMDFLLTDLNTIVRLYKNDGTGTFSSQSLTNELWAPTDIVGTNLDNDGDKDVVVVSFNLQSVYRMKQDASGNFEEPVEILDDFNSNNALVAGDFFNEGVNSIMAISQSNSLIKLIRNTGTGNFTSGDFIFPKYRIPQNGHYVDIDSDGIKDIIFISDNSEDIFVALGRCGGNFEKPVSWMAVGEGDLQHLKVADLDLDGDADLLLYQHYPEGEVKYALNDGNGNFGAFTVLYADNIFELEIADFNADDLPDILVRTNDSSEALFYYPNMGNATFGNPYIFNHNLFWSGDVEIGDLEGDGDLDIVQNHGQGVISWYINQGNGAFEEQQSLDDNSSLGYYSYNLKDADGDGDLDIFIARFSDFKVVWYENPGDNQFSTSNLNSLPTYSGLSFSTNLAQTWADIDYDGLEDLVINDRGSNQKFLWYRNLGEGEFAIPILIDELNIFSFLQGYDIEEDGDDDLLLFGESNHQISWLKNSLGTDTLEILVEVESENAGPCFDEPSGFIQVNTNAPVCTPYTIDWSNPGFEGFSLENLSPDLYIYTITNSLGFSLTDSVLITAPDELILSGDATASLDGLAQGMAWVEATGGVAPYTYEWSDAASSTTDTISNLNPGTYSVTVTDALGCTEITNATVEIIVALDEPFNKPDIRIYPTLVKADEINLQTSTGLSENATIVITNQLGQIVKQYHRPQLTTSEHFDVSDLKNGMYFFKLRVGELLKASVPFIIVK